jgi:hypothetical protein
MDVNCDPIFAPTQQYIMNIMACGHGTEKSEINGLFSHSEAAHISCVIIR